MTGFIQRWFTRPQTVTQLNTNPAAHGRELNSQSVEHKSDALTTTLPSPLYHRRQLLDALKYTSVSQTVLKDIDHCNTVNISAVQNSIIAWI